MERKAEQRIFFKVDVLAIRGGLIAKIGADGLATLCAIASFMDEEGYCYPTQETLAELTGVSRFTIIKRVRALMEAKLDDGSPILERAWKRRGGGVGKQSLYKVNRACGVMMGRDPKDVIDNNVAETHGTMDGISPVLQIGTINVTNSNIKHVNEGSHKEELLFKQNQEEKPYNVILNDNKDIGVPLKFYEQESFKRPKTLETGADVVEYFKQCFETKFKKSLDVQYAQGQGLITNATTGEDRVRIVETFIDEYEDRWATPGRMLPSIQSMLPCVSRILKVVTENENKGVFENV